MHDLTDISRPAVVASARKRTKIIATLGPVTSSADAVRGLVRAGVEIFRFNMSHGNHADHQARLDIVRQVSRELEVPLAVLADLQGPKIRTCRLLNDAAVEWKEGAAVVVTVAPCPEGTANRIGTTYPGLADDVMPGALLLVDDGRMKLRVERVVGDDIHCTVAVGGLLKNNKGINLPGVEVHTPSLSDKDIEDLNWALQNGVDAIAMSFVRTAMDVRNLKSRITRTGRYVPIIAKIEKPEAVENVDQILAAADGIMVARGDLGIEISTQKLPVVQKHLIQRANRMGKIVITATQMLESMIENPIPTRAESSDVANAIFDGTDAVMLSGETAYGKYPEEAVREMTRIAKEAEASNYLHVTEPDRDTAQGLDRMSFALAAAADALARDLPAHAVMIINDDGEIARLLGKRRRNVPLICPCSDETSWRRMVLHWGCVPLLIPGVSDRRGLFQAAVTTCLKQRSLHEGDTVVVVSGSGESNVDSITVRQVKG